MDGEQVLNIKDSEVGMITFQSDYAGTDAKTRRGVSIGGFRYEVTTIYNADRVGAENIDDRGDRYFVSFQDDDGTVYKLRFFFSGSTKESSIIEIDLLKSVT